MSSAVRVVLSYPATLSDWGREAIDRSSFREYLRAAHDEAHEGDVWTEFTGAGRCGDTLEVPLQVEDVTGGSAIAADTTFVFVDRDDVTADDDRSV